MEEKTVLEWLEQAKADGYEWADKAIKNCHESEMNTKQSTLSDALLHGFLWKQTLDGDRFWNNIHDQLLKKHL